jgi:hypothetical protein
MVALTEPTGRGSVYGMTDKPDARPGDEDKTASEFDAFDSLAKRLVKVSKKQLDQARQAKPA